MKGAAKLKTLRIYTDNPLRTKPASVARKKPDLYIVFWIFISGSAIGFVTETIWSVVRHGHIENRSSLIFCPLTMVYGFGALALYAGGRLRGGGNILVIFAYGAAVCTAAEYISSLAQEIAFGSVSWDYSDMPLSTGSRVYLPYSLAWGILGAIWSVKIQPLLESIYNRIPERIRKTVVTVVFVVLLLDIIISAAAVGRWGTRLDGAPAHSILSSVLDEFFPNQTMETIYPNMRWQPRI